MLSLPRFRFMSIGPLLNVIARVVALKVRDSVVFVGFRIILLPDVGWVLVSVEPPPMPSRYNCLLPATGIWDSDSNSVVADGVAPDPTGLVIVALLSMRSPGVPAPTVTTMVILQLPPEVREILDSETTPPA